MSTISIIGSGGMAAAIGGLAAKAGHAVEVMSRDAAKARALAAGWSRRDDRDFRRRSGRGHCHSGGSLFGRSDVVKQCGEKLAGKLIIDITNPIKSDFTGFLTPEESSGAQEIAKVAPANATIVKAFNTQNAQVLAAGLVGGDPLDVFIAGDDSQAKLCVSAFIDSLGLRPMDTGRLTMARTLEHACMLWLGLMAHSIKHTNFSIRASLFG
ncbi:NADPH-dependent F420 reductase [Sinorhizobium meliloti]|uniref:NADPH-dependent F420 reductase n=1 Tax=Rhizobium meliloti TaxID=382 RepID=UPI001911DE5D|nr:hypothetical protein [Sinorhizobium meliloti]